MSRTLTEIQKDIDSANSYAGSNNFQVQKIALEWLQKLLVERAEILTK